MYQHQDWEPVVLRKKSTTETETVLRKKEEGPVNKKKVDQNLEEFKHKKIPKNISDAIMKRRIELKMTQAQLAQKINERPSVVNEIENGSAPTYNHVHVNKILRALGLTLRACGAAASAAALT